MDDWGFRDDDEDDANHTGAGEKTSLLSGHTHLGSRARGSR
jgi:hypothetical protein